MFARIIVPINIVLGVALVLGGLLFPWLANQMEETEISTLKNKVETLVKQEELALTVNKRYLQFSSATGEMHEALKKMRLDPEVFADGYRFNAMVNQNGVLVVRGFTDPGAIKGMFTAVGMYEVTMGANGAAPVRRTLMQPNITLGVSGWF